MYNTRPESAQHILTDACPAYVLYHSPLHLPLDMVWYPMIPYDTQRYTAHPNSFNPHPTLENNIPTKHIFLESPQNSKQYHISLSWSHKIFFLPWLATRPQCSFPHVVPLPHRYADLARSEYSIVYIMYIYYETRCNDEEYAASVYVISLISIFASRGSWYFLKTWPNSSLKISKNNNIINPYILWYWLVEEHVRNS